MSINIGTSTLSHRIHGFIKNDPYSANKEYIDNQEDAIEAFKEQKDCPEDYKPKIILHIEREINDDLTERTTITRLDNGCGMNNIDVYIDPSNSTTKKDKNGNYCEGMFNSALSLKPYTQTVVSRGSNNKANSLIFYPSKMIKTVKNGLKENKTFGLLDSELNQNWIVHEHEKHENSKKVIDWSTLLTNIGTIINEEIEKIKNGGCGTIQQQVWKRDCPLTKKIIENYNNSLKYKRNNFKATYIFNNKEFCVDENCFIPKNYNIIKFDIKIHYVDGNFKKLFIKFPNGEILFCTNSKNDRVMKKYNDEKFQIFDQNLSFKLALISSDDAKKQLKELALNYIGELKRPIIETKTCKIGIGKTIFSTHYNSHHMFNCSEQIHPRSSFCINSNFYKIFGVTCNKDVPNLSNPDPEVKKLLANFVGPLYKYCIKKYGRGGFNINEKKIGNKGLKEDEIWEIEEMMDFILSKKTKKSPKPPVVFPKTPIQPPKQPIQPLKQPIQPPKQPIQPPKQPPKQPIQPPTQPNQDNQNGGQIYVPTRTISPRRRGHISQERREKLWLEQFGDNFNVRCVCESIINPFTANLGHIKAFSMGGSCKDENLYYICKKCNGNDTNPIQNMIEKKYGKEHEFYKKLIDDFVKLNKIWH
jgi:hypothetical protein